MTSKYRIGLKRQRNISKLGDGILCLPPPQVTLKGRQVEAIKLSVWLNWFRNLVGEGQLQLGLHESNARLIIVLDPRIWDFGTNHWLPFLIRPAGWHSNSSFGALFALTKRLAQMRFVNWNSFAGEFELRWRTANFKVEFSTCILPCLDRLFCKAWWFTRNLSSHLTNCTLTEPSGFLSTLAM